MNILPTYIISYTRVIVLFFISVFLLFTACNTSSHDHMLELLPPDSTGIYFENNVHDTRDFNILNYLYFYDGGGVAAGDINNDGLTDLYFTANDQPDRLYLNEGDFKFSDITKKSGVLTDDNGWSTGVTMADVNGDGLLDIYTSRVTYLSKSGRNQLFINNGDTTFTERAAEYGLDFEGYSTQAAFFDYDLDGDLDMFLLNHTMHGENSYGEAEELRKMDHPKAGDRLFRNDDGTFTDVSDRAGIFSSHLGYGLGIVVSDINLDGWPDIYIGNDFHEDDYLYINQGDGSFNEVLDASIHHTSRSTMGVDIADMTNDTKVEIAALDMLPASDEIRKQSGGADLKKIAETKAAYGFKPQFAQNTLQLHRGFKQDATPVFSEIAFSAGIAATDWSWSALIMDLDNNGHNDLLATNGIYRRPNDLDFVDRYRNFQKEQISGRLTGEQMQLIEEMPHVKRRNFIFANTGSFPLHDVTREWGVGQQSYSNGAAYADLNNNGRLDLIINNVNMPAFVYRNRSRDSLAQNYLSIKLEGNSPNTRGIGAKIIAYGDSSTWYREQYPTRGFQSSVPHRLHVGLGKTERLDSLVVIWPDRSYQTLYDVAVNQQLTVDQANSSGNFNYRKFRHPQRKTFFTDVTETSALRHQPGSSDVDDIQQSPLKPFSHTTGSPALAVADVNGDSLDDVYLGGAEGVAGTLFIQNKDGSFLQQDESVFELHSKASDVDALFFDANGDDHPDLYVVSGGGWRTGADPALIDRLYINDGNGQFHPSRNSLPVIFSNGSSVAATDFDGDGDQDVFVGGKSVPRNYGKSPESYLLRNDGNAYFTEVTDSLAPKLQNIGMVTDASWHNLDQQGRPELILAGEWMPLTIFAYNGDRWVDKTESYGLAKTGGLWQSLSVSDLNNDGSPDIAAGNFGTNSQFKASPESPLRLYIHPFAGSGKSVPVIATEINSEWKPFETLDELAQELPALKEKFKSYKHFSTSPLSDIFSEEDLEAAMQKSIYTLESTIFYQQDDKTFSARALSFLSQISPVYALLPGNFNNDAHTDLLLGGNLTPVRPSYGGSLDAGSGLLLSGSSTTDFQPTPHTQSGFLAEGQIRAIKSGRGASGRTYIFVARHNQQPLIFTYKFNSQTE